MSATTVTRAPINDTDANFRLWGKAISDQLSAGSLVQTPDTGQINWATVVKPAAISTIQGYEIWRSSDGGNNWYLKIDYGSGSANANSPAIGFQIGWGSDGAGALTGNFNTRRTIAPAVAGSSTLYNCNLAAGTNWLCLALFTGSSQWGQCLSIERTISSTGSFNDEVLVFRTLVGGIIDTQVCPRTGAIPPVITAGSGVTQVVVDNTSSAALYGSDAGVCLQFGQKGGLTNPSLNVVGGHTAIFTPAQATVTIDTYGATHTYIINATLPQYATSISLLSRFE